MPTKFEPTEEPAESTETPWGSEESDFLDALMTASDCADFLSISLPTFWRRVNDGTIPRPIKLGALSRWPKSEILAVIASAKAKRDNA